MLSVMIDDITGFLLDNGYKRYPKNIYRPLIPLSAIFFFVKNRDVIILEIPENVNNIIIYEYTNLDENMIKEIEQL